MRNLFFVLFVFSFFQNFAQNRNEHLGMELVYVLDVELTDKFSKDFPDMDSLEFLKEFKSEINFYDTLRYRFRGKDYVISTNSVDVDVKIYLDIDKKTYRLNKNKKKIFISRKDSSSSLYNETAFVVPNDSIQLINGFPCKSLYFVLKDKYFEYIELFYDHENIIIEPQLTLEVDYVKEKLKGKKQFRVGMKYYTEEFVFSFLLVEINKVVISDKEFKIPKFRKKYILKNDSDMNFFNFD